MCAVGIVDEYAMQQSMKLDRNKLGSTTKDSLNVEGRKLEGLMAESESPAKSLEEVLSNPTQDATVSGRMADLPCAPMPEYGGSEGAERAMKRRILCDSFVTSQVVSQSERPGDQPEANYYGWAQELCRRGDHLQAVVHLSAGGGLQHLEAYGRDL